MQEQYKEQNKERKQAQKASLSKSKKNAPAITAPSEKKELMGRVLSDLMDKTVVVSVERTYMDSRSKKIVRARKKYKVHDEQEQAHKGDWVTIYQGRPQSKTKYMYLARIVTKSME